MLKKLSKLIFFFFLSFIAIDIVSDYEIKKVDIVIENKIKNKVGDGYIYFTNLNKKLIIKSGNVDEILKGNDVAIIDNGSTIDSKYGNLVLAGHNKKNVFSILYTLKIGDEIIISNYDNDYLYEIYDISTINITDTYILDNVIDNKILTLITCTNNNQKRLIIRARIK